MIGVVCQPGEVGVVEEFFQMFKTPWEFYQAGRHYDAVVASVAEPPGAAAAVLVLYGAAVGRGSGEDGAVRGERLGGICLEAEGKRVPIYGEVIAFDDGDACLLRVARSGQPAGIKLERGGRTIYRLGYDLFQEISFLQTQGQPVENAGIPTLELHIRILRMCLVDGCGVLLEIPPVPAGHSFIACLTHDIDFVGIRRHKFDHTMWGFLWRSTAGAVLEFLRQRISLGRMAQMWGAAARLPLVYLRWAKDFWMPFEWYLRVERGLPATYFLVPFKNRPGERVNAPHAERRGVAYDVTELADWTARLMESGCEIGVHGIDAWHSAERGREELKRVSGVTGRGETGIRMHWLLRSEESYGVLDQAGYAYDSTAGYNETVGYRCWTSQAFRPVGARNLMELPMHIQDGALFYRGRLGLSDAEAWGRCQHILDEAEWHGGVITCLWHDRSPGPERYWGEFYIRLIEDLKSRAVWFASAGQAVKWFRKRRAASFERTGAEDGGRWMRLRSFEPDGTPPLVVRVHRAPRGSGAAGIQGRMGSNRFIDLPWSGESDLEVGSMLAAAE